MKKVTIITPPEYEGLVLESLGKSQVIQFTQVTGTDYEALKDPSGKAIDYRFLYNKINNRYDELLKMGDIVVERKIPSIEELREFTLSPEGKVEAVIDETTSLIEEIKEKQEHQHIENNRFVKELQSELDVEREKFEKEKGELVGKLADRVILSFIFFSEDDPTLLTHTNF